MFKIKFHHIANINSYQSKKHDIEFIYKIYKMPQLFELILIVKN